MFPAIVYIVSLMFLRCLPFISYQGRVTREATPLLRRNSFTPLSSNEVKRPRLYSAGSRRWLPLAHTPAALMPEGQQSEVSVRITLFKSTILISPLASFPSLTPHLIFSITRPPLDGFSLCCDVGVYTLYSVSLFLFSFLWRCHGCG